LFLTRAAGTSLIPSPQLAAMRMQLERDLQQQLVLLSVCPEQPPLQYPEIWLRDNCQCGECYMQQTRSRLPQGWNYCEPTVRAQQLHWAEEQQCLLVEWSDAHCSAYSWNWLRERDFSPANRARYLRDFYRPEARHWSRVQFGELQREFHYGQLLQCDRTLLEWLQQLAVYGVALVKQAPLETDVLRRLCQRVGFMRRTTYGEEWSVRAQPGARNYAYLAAPLPLHTDMPYFEYKPGLTLLHTLQQSDSPGGWNLLADGFHVADLLRERHPQAFQVLAETPVDWADIGSERELSFHNIWRAPVINLDPAGRYTRINHSIPQRDSHFSVPVEQVRPWYEAMALFIRLANEQACSFKTCPGDVLVFDNLRLVHGRTGYDDTERNVRHIVGAFLDWDIAYSRWRCLRNALGVQQQ
ncbi:hypothetical protein KR222_001183, partial [Zaprionus bogoriensis]